MCRYCGRMYFPHDIQPHELQCYNKLQQQGLLSKKIEPPEYPEPWKTPAENDERGRQNYNYQAFQYYQRCVIKCKRCQRLIPMIEIADHLCHCDEDIKPSSYGTINQSPKSQNFPVQNSTRSQNSGQFQIPEYSQNQFDNRIACRRCGRKFAPNRIDQHEKICMNLKYKVQNVEEQKQPKQEQKEIKQIQQKPQKQLDPYEKQKMEDNRYQCRFCGRGFSRDRIEKHEQICGNLTNMKPTYRYENQQGKLSQSQKIVNMNTIKEELSQNTHQISISGQKSQQNLNQLSLSKSLNLSKSQGNQQIKPLQHSQQLYCSQCGNKFNDKDKFCCMCGSKRF